MFFSSSWAAITKLLWGWGMGLLLHSSVCFLLFLATVAKLLSFLSFFFPLFWLLYS